MALVTLCPECGTAYRVNAAQLQAHNGDVRCGQCQQIFNGFSTLITADESTLAYPEQLQTADSRLETVNDSPSAKTATTSENIEEVQELSTIAAFKEINKATVTDVFDAPRVSRPLPWRWGAVNILLVIVLIGQITFTNRTALTVQFPDSRVHWERLCAVLACTVPYPQDIKRIGIEASDLQKHPARHPEMATLNALIRNHASFSQGLPALQLSLLDAQDQLLASRIFTAQEYLPESEKSLQFMRPQQEIEVQLNFDNSRLHAWGYRLQLLYP